VTCFNLSPPILPSPFPQATLLVLVPGWEILTSPPPLLHMGHAMPVPPFSFTACYTTGSPTTTHVFTCYNSYIYNAYPALPCITLSLFTQYVHVPLYPGIHNRCKPFVRPSCPPKALPLVVAATTSDVIWAPGVPAILSQLLHVSLSTTIPGLPSKMLSILT
jgi:hypothetical protein